MSFTYPSNVVFECSRCGLCCGDTQQKKRHILLLESEVNSISAKTALPIEDFSTQIKGRAPYSYEMKKKCEGKCFFLEDNQCRVYESRPLICIFYPFELRFSENQGAHVFDFTVECPGIGKGKILCKNDFKKLFLVAQERLGQRL